MSITAPENCNNQEIVDKNKSREDVRITHNFINWLSNLLWPETVMPFKPNHESPLSVGENLVFYLPICLFYYLAKYLQGRVGSLYFFLEGGFKGNYLKGKILPFAMWFQIFYPYFLCEALRILYNQTFL